MPAKPVLRNRILELIAEEPMTLTELMHYFPNHSSKTIDNTLRDLRTIGLVRIHGWHRNYGKRGQPSGMWGLADGKKDAVKPKVDTTRKQKYEDNHRLLRAMRKKHKRDGQPPSATWVMMYQLKKAA